MPPVHLSTLAVVLGLATAVPQVFGLAKPAATAASIRRFPRSLPWGVALMLIGTGWFVWNLNQEPIADFAKAKPYLLVFFAAVGILACIFVQDLLAVRGLAIVLLLLAKLMVDTGRPALGQTPWVLLFQGWAYVWVVMGLWLTVSPWRLRDLLDWIAGNQKRVRLVAGVRLGFGLLITVLGFTAFRGL